MKWGVRVSDEGGTILNQTVREDSAEVPPERRPQGSKAVDHANRRGKNAPGRWV